MFDSNWTTASLKRLVLPAIDCFGPSRCMFASNFPVDKLMRSYAALWQAYDEITASFSAAERSALFHDTAARTYRIGSQ